MKPIAGFAVLSSQGVSPKMKIALAMLLLAGAAFAWSHDDWRYEFRRERTEARQARMEVRRDVRQTRLETLRELREERMRFRREMIEQRREMRESFRNSWR
ncbi:MAG: hypothetical protein ABSB35_14635 [Bryobacteraceae bacterium]|jgi:hypothetical protein